MNGRWFAKRQLIAEYYDGFTNYDVRESDEQEEERIKKWHAWLEAGDEKNQKKGATEEKKNTEEDDG
jgi:HIV Tat-specific factor 1